MEWRILQLEQSEPVGTPTVAAFDINMKLDASVG